MTLVEELRTKKSRDNRELLDRAADRIEELERKQSEWISVDERLPEKARDYLCRCVIRDNADYPFFMVLRYILIDENPHFQHECDNGLRVTHWMPLPEAPKMEGGE